MRKWNITRKVTGVMLVVSLLVSSILPSWPTGIIEDNEGMPDGDVDVAVGRSDMPSCEPVDVAELFRKEDSIGDFTSVEQKSLFEISDTKDEPQRDFFASLKETAGVLQEPGEGSVTGNDDTEASQESVIFEGVEDGISVYASTQSSGHIEGTDISFTLQDGILTLFGSGTVYYRMFGEYMDVITRVVISSGITLGADAFNGMSHLTSVTIDDGVSSIGERAFFNCTALTSVSIPSSVKTVGIGAFAYCTALSSITIPNGTTALDAGAFMCCDRLCSVSLPDSMTIIGDVAFGNCPVLETITIPAGLHTLGAYAFSDCTGLKTIRIQSGLQSIGEHCFVNCPFTECILPDTVTNIDAEAFAYCTSLEKIVLSSRLTAISDDVFYCCTSLKNIEIPDSVSSIGIAAFWKCESLEEVTFPAGYIDVGEYAFSFCDKAVAAEGTIHLGNVGEQAFINTSIPRELIFSSAGVRIGRGAFHGCSDLKKIDFQNTHLSVGEYAFFGCPNLKTIEHEPVYSSVGEAAFQGCPAITEVVLDEACTEVGAGSFLDCDNLTNIDFAQTNVYLERFAFAYCDSLSTMNGNENIQRLGYGCFYECRKLSSAKGFSALKEVEPYAFYDCESLTEASIPSTVTSIGQCAFTHCIKLQSIQIPDSVKTLEVATFLECDSLVSVTISDQLQSIGELAFAQCDALQTVSGGSGVKTIGERAFSFCTKLQSAEFSAALQTVEDIAFYDCGMLEQIGTTSNLEHVGWLGFGNCKKIKQIILSDQLDYVGDFAFRNCESITSVTIPGTVTYLGEDAFLSCVSLREVALGEGLDKISMETFAECSALSGIRLPSTVVKIEDCAFYGCKSLSEVVFSDGISEIGDGAFYECAALQSVSLPDSVKTVGISVFKGCSSLRSAVLPSNLENVSDGLFYGCSSLSEVRMPGELRDIGYASFYECNRLEQVSLPESLSKISDYAFTSCSSLKAVDVPDGVVSIGDSAFAYCTSLSKAVLSKALIMVGNYLFYGCSAMDEVKLRGEIIAIGARAFYDCDSLKNLTIASGIPAVIGEAAFEGTSNRLVMHYNSAVDGWTTPTWKGPDDETYQTIPFEAEISGSCGEHVTWEYYTDSGSLFISGEGRMEDYEREIDQPWYAYQNEIAAVRISNGVKSVGKRAFSGCSMLRSAVLADSVEECGDYAFSDCENLTSAALSNGLCILGDYLFYGCTSLRELALPDSLEAIGRYAFFNCRSLEYIVVPDTVASIGEGCFYYCMGIRDIVWPSAMDLVPDYAFTNCTSLKTAVLPEKTKRISKSAFRNCTELSNVYMIGNNVEIDAYAFYGCGNLASVCFAGTKPSVLGYRAFGAGNAELHMYHLNAWAEESLTAADGGSYPCSLYAPELSGECGTGVNWLYLPEFGLLHIRGTGNMADMELLNQPWGSQREVIASIVTDSGITGIGANAFRGCVQLRSASLSSGLTAIGENAFAGCTSLASVNLPSGLLSLGKAAFYHCQGMHMVRLPNTLDIVPDYVFAMCTGLRSVKLGMGIGQIGYSAFYACESLREIIIPDSVTTIDAWAFARCTGLAAVDVGIHTAGLGDSCFYGCTGLTGIYLHSVEQIGSAAFCGTALLQVDIPAETEKIGAFAFGGCAALTDITVSPDNLSFADKDGVLYSSSYDRLYQYPAGKKECSVVVPEETKIIGEGAFYDCSAEEILLPEGLEILEEAAFADCANLTAVTIPEQVASISDGAFYHCEMLQAVTLGAGVTEIGTEAFQDCSALNIVHYQGGTPERIGAAAFERAGDYLCFYYKDTSSGWMPDIWTGPDGIDYSTFVWTEEQMALTAGETGYEEDSGTLTSTFTIRNLQSADEKVRIVAAAYKNDEMIASKTKSVSLEAGGITAAALTVNGGLSEDVSFQIFLVRQGSYEPIADHLVIPCEYTADGACTLQIAAGEEAEVTASVSEQDVEQTEELLAQNAKSSRLSAEISFTASEFDIMLSAAETGCLSGFGSQLRLFADMNGTEKEIFNTSYTTYLDIENYDSAGGYTACSIEDINNGLVIGADLEGKSWKIPGGALLSHNSGTLVTADNAHESSELHVGISGDASDSITFGWKDLDLIALRAAGYYAMGNDPVVQKKTDGNFLVLAPGRGKTILYDVHPMEIVRAMRAAAEKSRNDGIDAGIYDVSLLTGDLQNEKETVLELHIVMEGDEVVSVTADARAGKAAEVSEYDYCALSGGETIEADDQMKFAVLDVSPAQGSNGTVTLHADGTLFEASASAVLQKDSERIEAEQIYYYDHTKLYATFDLSQASDGIYDFILQQKGSEAACVGSFTVDSSLPKGSIQPSINVDQAAQKDTVYKGSVTFVNTGYTDVYAPIIEFQTEALEIKDADGDSLAEQAVFVTNQEGLPGILSNGQTAAVNFEYKPTASNGYSLSVYNYADITEAIAVKPELNKDSGVSDIRTSNLLELTGTRVCDYAESIAQMACVLGSLGEDCYDQDYLQSAYLAEAEGVLAGSMLASASDLTSRALSLERYYSTDITTHQRDGLFGMGWYTDYEVSAEYNENYIFLTSPVGTAVYLPQDGVYTEIVHGASTAKLVNGAVCVTEQDGATMSFRPDGKLGRITDAYGSYIACEYGADGKLTAVASDNGDRLALTYQDGHVIRVESALTGNIAEYKYLNGMLQSVSTPYGVTAYGYELVYCDGRKNALTDIAAPSGVIMHYEYDKLGRVTGISNGEGTMAYSYDGIHEVTVTDTLGNVTRMFYDGVGNPVRTIDARGNMSEQRYSEDFVPQSSSYGLFSNYSYQYDNQQNLTQLTDASGQSVSYTYDADGNVTGITDRAGTTTGYEWGSLGEVTRITYADGSSEGYEYDDKGNVTAAVMADGTRIEYGYDAYSQLVSVSYSTGEYLRYSYDDVGNLVEINENGNKTGLAYNSRGDLKQVQHPDGKTVSYEYDTVGNVVTSMVAYGESLNTTHYTYDAYNRLESVGFAAPLVTYAYNADGSIKKQTNYNGTYTEYEYDKGLLTLIRNCKKDGTVMSSFAYTYDEMGYPATMTDNTGTWRYSYDKLGQLIRAVAPDGTVTTYSYDKAGNRTSKLVGSSYENYNSNERNQYTAYGNTVRSYDANGNLISETGADGTTDYEYDYLERLVKVMEPDGTVTQYAYDAFGYRNAVSVSTPNGSETDVQTTEYLYSPLGDGYPLASYKNDKASFFVQGNGMAAWYVSDQDSAELYAYSYNHLGSTAEMTDQAGNIVNRYTYDVEGNKVSAVEGVANPFTYAGKYGIMDDGNGLYYDRARYLSAATMSYISQDPTGQENDLNVYRYAYNNPVAYVDVTGEVPVQLITAGVGAVVSGGSLFVADVVSLAFGGEMSSGAEYLGAFVGGAVQGAMVTIDPLAAGAVGAFVGSIVTDLAEGKGVNWGDIGFETVFGGASSSKIVGKFSKQALKNLKRRISGKPKKMVEQLLSSKESYEKFQKYMQRKIKNGKAKRISMKTLKKETKKGMKWQMAAGIRDAITQKIAKGVIKLGAKAVKAVNSWISVSTVKPVTQSGGITEQQRRQIAQTILAMVGMRVPLESLLVDRLIQNLKNSNIMEQLSVSANISSQIDSQIELITSAKFPPNNDPVTGLPK